MREPDRPAPPAQTADRPPAALAAIALIWTRIGLAGFGRPPAHIALLRRLVVEREGWLDAREFEDADAACGLLPGPASISLRSFCACRAGGIPGAIVGGLGFVVPALAAAAVALPPLRRGVVPTLLAAGAVGVVAALTDAPLP